MAQSSKEISHRQTCRRHREKMSRGYEKEELQDTIRELLHWSIGRSTNHCTYLEVQRMRLTSRYTMFCWCEACEQAYQGRREGCSPIELKTDSLFLAEAVLMGSKHIIRPIFHHFPILPACQCQQACRWASTGQFVRLLYSNPEHMLGLFRQSID